MTALKGLRVVELGTWVAVPAAGLLMSDWGAEVIKIEPPDNGDPLRSLVKTGFLASEPEVNPVFELENRGKRSVAIDLRDPGQRRELDLLLGTADVLLTNLRAPSLDRHGLAWNDIRDRHPHLIYGRITGYGSSGEEKDRPAYDYSAFWGRSGLLDSMSQGQELAAPRPGVGDHAAALALCSGVLAALRDRERTGLGQTVDVSLYRTGVWLHSMETQLHQLLGGSPETRDDRGPNPLFSAYETADGRWLYLMLGQPERDWPRLCEALKPYNFPEHDEFESQNARNKNSGELRRQLEETFSGRDLAHWTSVLDEHGIVWGAVRTVSESIKDPQLRSSGGFRDVATKVPIEVVAPPIDLSGTTVANPAPRAPSIGEDNIPILGTANGTPDGAGILDLVGVGIESEEQRWSYTERDTLLYNLSVGASPEEPLLVFERGISNLLAVPTLGLLPALPALDWLQTNLRIKPGEFILGEQELRLTRTMPIAATLATKYRLDGVYDKGSSALAVVAASSAEAGEHLCENVFRIFLTRRGGFGGDRGPRSLLGAWPEREVDHQESFVAPATAPLLYRLNGDWHPVHADPEAAYREGHPRSPLHGMYLLGQACRRVMSDGAEKGRILSTAIRYLGPAYPEEELGLRYWRDEPNTFVEVFAVEREAGVCRIRITQTREDG